jgi:hypothetical protein
MLMTENVSERHADLKKNCPFLVSADSSVLFQ